MKKFFITLGSLALLASLVFVPVYVGAETTGASLGLFPCNGVVDATKDNSGECTFNDVLKLANSIIKAIFIAILIISPLLIAYAGYRYIVSGGKPAERAKASQQLLNLVIGLVIVACSYGVVKLVLNVLLSPTTITTF
ncbi:MAG: Type secretion system pilin [Candidatus Parcubacteria bacterium]|jgi:hypothetical protein